MGLLKAVKLHNFRCYEKVELAALSAGFIVLFGANGAGKTNILEALSLLSSGRGLRGAKALEIQKNDSADPWAISASIISHYGDETIIGTGLDPNYLTGTEKRDKRIIRINGTNVKSQAALGQYLSCVWLTPQMDRLFMDSARERRKFLDRLVCAFDAGHSSRITRYENALSQRSKLLRDGASDDRWLSALEQQMAETSIAIAAARLDFVARLQVACKNSDNEFFPLADFKVKGSIEEWLYSSPALEVEDKFRAELVQSRARDAITGGAMIGVHKSDLVVNYAAKNMPADQCSTGEQKALLIGLIIAHARLIKAERGAPPILLLDEVAAHLDETRRSALYKILQDLGAQIWLTGTDRNLFAWLEGKAQFFEVKDSCVQALNS